MKRYYFVGGPKEGCSQEFFAHLGRIGGTPKGWIIFPHAANDGKALHIVENSSEEEIFAHLQHFDGIYEHGEIREIVAKV
jgi:hypothetical protein